MFIILCVYMSISAYNITSSTSPIQRSSVCFIGVVCHSLLEESVIYLENFFTIMTAGCLEIEQFPKRLN